MIELLIIALLIVYVTDITRFPDSLLRIFWKVICGTRPFPDGLYWEKVHPALKVLECSRCQIWWVTLVITLIVHPSIYMVGYCGLLSLFAPIFKDIEMMVTDIFTRIINGLYKIFNL